MHYRLGVDAKVREQISQIEREYSDYIVELHLYRCEIGGQEPEARTVNAMRWATYEEMEELEFTPADEESMRRLLFGDE